MAAPPFVFVLQGVKETDHLFPDMVVLNTS